MSTHWRPILDKVRNQQLTELKELLAIPSISSLSEHSEDVKNGADWIAEALKRSGMENVTVMPTDRHPVVYGDWLHAEGKPTVLIYGHYDVQPVDPLELWDTPPFTPDIRDEKIYARGATDDKGQVFMHIKALEVLLANQGELPLNVKFCIEGEEEIGSPSLDGFVDEHKDLLAADTLVVSDNPMLERASRQSATAYVVYVVSRLTSKELTVTFILAYTAVWYKIRFMLCPNC